MIGKILVAKNGNALDLMNGDLFTYKGNLPDRYTLVDSDKPIDMDTFVKKYIRNRIEKAKDVASDDKRGILALVPNLECHGNCEYCYAASTTHDTSSLLTKDMLYSTLNKSVGEDFLEKFREIVVYGGESLIYSENIVDLVSEFDVAGVSIVTGLLFSDSIFDKALEAIKDKNIDLCISFDPPPLNNEWANYTRRIPGVQGEELYNLLLSRIGILMNTISGRCTFRSTITDNCVEWTRMASDISRVSGVPIDQLHISVEVEDKSTISEATLLHMLLSMEEWNDNGNIVVNNADRFTPTVDDGVINGMFSYFGDCDFMIGSVTVNSFGNISPCPSVAAGAYLDEIPSTQYDIVNKRVTNLWDKCKDCTALVMCGGFCWITEPTDARCVWRQVSIYEGIYQWLMSLDMKDIEKQLINSVV